MLDFEKSEFPSIVQPRPPVIRHRVVCNPYKSTTLEGKSPSRKMNRADIVHAVNSVYGRRNLYGARSAYIACSTPSDMTLLAYCKDIEPQTCRPDNVTTTRVRLSFCYRAKRSLMKRTGRKHGKLRASWKGFDVSTARKLSRLDSGTIKVFHSWEWMPRTFATVRNQHPGASIVRDVTIASRFDYHSGEDIMNEVKLVDCFLSPSAYVTGCLQDWGISDSMIIEIPFGVDTRLFRPAPIQSGKPIRFAFTGMVCARKGMLRLLRVWKRLSLRKAELHLYGTVKPDVREKLADVTGVYTYGFMDITGELAKNHVFVFPSSLEGSSKSVFEALACGLPVITTPNSGSVVRHGIDGYIVGPEDEEALGEAIKTLYENHRLRNKMSANARHRAEEFTWNAYASRVWETYGSLSESKSTSAKT
jgi:glycosyltransferase involved in cell wall biosynthesis